MHAARSKRPASRRSRSSAISCRTASRRPRRSPPRRRWSSEFRCSTCAGSIYAKRRRRSSRRSSSLGIADPTNLRALDEIKFHTNLTVEPIIVPEDLLDRAIEQALAGVESLNEQMGDDEGIEGLELESGTDDEL